MSDILVATKNIFATAKLNILILFLKRRVTFHIYRVGEIQELTNSEDWLWVPTKENVADDATRDVNLCDVSNSSRWFKGPEFLYHGEEDWPIESTAKTTEIGDDTEFVALIKSPNKTSLPDISRFLSWLKVIRATSWILRFVKMCKIKKRSNKVRGYSELTPEELEAAELLWIKKVQSDHFIDEIRGLTSSQAVLRSSRLYNLSPKLDDNGILRVQGRIDKCDLDEFVKNPYILDPSHRYSRLLINHYHQMLEHQGQETIINEIWVKYWILKVRGLVRKICRDCQYCKVKRCKPIIPEMGQLPDCRLIPQLKPFVYFGIDFFGPLLVKVGQKKVKRYGVIFTCMASRAIHNETAASLTTDSTIMAIRRFMAKRDEPKVIYLDNGTNFRGADKELKVAIQDLDNDTIQTKLAPKTRWLFNPPQAPHFEGSWERLIRSVQTASTAILKGRIPTEEVFQTLMVEAEHIVNCRPLTRVSCDINNPTSLTPHNFLIPYGVTVSSGLFTNSDLRLRKEWRKAQLLCDHFWKRWVKGYLPTLLQRTKWLQGTDGIKVGDVCVLVDFSGPRNCWPMGIIVQTYPGKDGIVRVCDVQTQGCIFRRPVTKICILDVSKTEGSDD